MNNHVLQLTQEEYDLCVQLNKGIVSYTELTKHNNLLNNISTKVLKIPELCNIIDNDELSKMGAMKKLMDYIFNNAQVVN